MTSTASRVFNFVRGAVRGLNGSEDFSNINFLVVGVNPVGQEIFQCVSTAPDASVYFANDPSLGLREYTAFLTRYPSVEYYDQRECIDIVIDSVKEEVRIAGKVVPFGTLTEDSYTQGIHEFYL